MKQPYLMAGLLLVLTAPALANPDFSTLEERMTGREFRDTGLHKLTEQELAALNRWIRERSLAEGESLAPASGSSEGQVTGEPASDRRGLLESTDERPIETRIVGEFAGWDGYTTFELENGMVWEQIDGKALDFPTTLQNPRVTIAPGAFGSWRLRVEGYNARAQVRRVR